MLDKNFAMLDVKDEDVSSDDEEVEEEVEVKEDKEKNVNDLNN